MRTHQSFGQPANENISSMRRSEELQQHGRELIENVEEAVDLLNEIGSIETELAEIGRKIDVFGSALYEARIKGENGRKSGFEFVQEMENTLSTLAKENRLTFLGSLALSSKWVSSGLEPPESLASTSDAIGRFLKSESSQDSEFVKKILDFRLNQLSPESKDVPFILHKTIVSSLPSLPSSIKYEFVRMAVGMPDERFAELGCSLLFMNNETIRRAAIDGLSDRLDSGSLTSDILAKLTLIRSWLNSSETIRLLDQLLRDSKKKGFEITGSKTVFKHRSAIASAVDGTGAQNITVLIKTRKSHKLAILLLKQGFGVRDAYVVPCQSKNQQVKFIENWKNDVEPVETYEVPMEFVMQAVASALHQGAQNNVAQAPGLVECVEYLGLLDTRPEGGSLSEMLAKADPNGKIINLDEGKLAELVENSGFWPVTFDFLQQWFEKNDSSDEILMSNDSVEDKWKRLYEFLYDRREFWSPCIVRMAMLLSSVQHECSDEFIAVAVALERDWDLEKIPVFEIIISQTIENWLLERGMAVSNEMISNPAAESTVAAPRISMDDMEYQNPVNARKELKKLLAPTKYELEWLDGFFAGMCTAPVDINFAEHFGSVLEKVWGDFPSKDAFDETLRLLNLDYNYVNFKLSDGKTLEILPAETSELSSWATGFLSAWYDYPRSCPPELLGQKRRKIQASLKLAANSDADPADFRKKFTEWLEHCRSEIWS